MLCHVPHLIPAVHDQSLRKIPVAVGDVLEDMDSGVEWSKDRPADHPHQDPRGTHGDQRYSYHYPQDSSRPGSHLFLCLIQALYGLRRHLFRNRVHVSGRFAEPEYGPIRRLGCGDLFGLQPLQNPRHSGRIRFKVALDGRDSLLVFRNRRYPPQRCELHSHTIEALPPLGFGVCKLFAVVHAEKEILLLSPELQFLYLCACRVDEEGRIHFQCPLRARRDRAYSPVRASCHSEREKGRDGTQRDQFIPNRHLHRSPSIARSLPASVPAVARDTPKRDQPGRAEPPREISAPDSRNLRTLQAKTMPGGRCMEQQARR
jgi:hypothetical protein